MSGHTSMPMLNQGFRVADLLHQEPIAPGMRRQMLCRCSTNLGENP